MTVSIRPLKIEDAYTSVKWRNDSEVFRYTGNTYDHNITIESELAWIKRVINKEDDYRCAIEVDGIYVGNIYLTDIHDGEAEYHIFIGNKEYWGKGVAKEASKQILTYAKEKLSLHDVILEVRRENVRAIELYKAVGFQFIKAEGDKWIMRVDINQEKPLVAIHCLVYNHEPYLRDCFEGFVMQKTNFRFVAIVHEDCSTDNSAAIIREYEAKYPDIFRPIYETENQYSKPDGSLGRIMNAAIDATGAKYIAMCEGDDYWTDPYKLQKQVDFLESHPDYSLCFTNSMVRFPDHEEIAINHVWDTYTIEDIINTNALNTGERGDKIVPCAHTSSVMYRRQECWSPRWMKKCFIGDEPLFIAMAQYGKAKFINEPMTVYRAGVGVSSKGYQEIKDWSNRVTMYHAINEGLEFKYKNLINPIIAKFEYKIFRRMWKTGQKLKALRHLVLSVRADYRILLNRIMHNTRI